VVDVPSGDCFSNKLAEKVQSVRLNTVKLAEANNHTAFAKILLSCNSAKVQRTDTYKLLDTYAVLFLFRRLWVTGDVD
jgi:hypothetical protein